MQSAREFLLNKLLPTTSDKERELWFRTNEMAQKFLEIMKSYATEIVYECSRRTEDFNLQDPFTDQNVNGQVVRAIENIINEIN